ncbi:MAG: right-handed parallel beta-helix repeat-containing protein [Capsulimonadaceae bacterium]|nr:right-handed parallel beta-helix repeat-containing protein [Capsulimonadaceae bacterium]
MHITPRSAGCFCAVVLLFATVAISRGAPVVSAGDPTSVQQAIDAAYAAGQKSITLPPGKYEIHGNAKARAHLSFDGMHDFTIDATGVTLAGSAGKGMIEFHDCANVTLRGATVMRTTVPSSQGTVEAIDPKRWYIDIRVHAGYAPDCQGIGMLYTYAAGSRLPKLSVPMQYSGWAEHMSNGLVRLHFHLADNVPLIVGDRIAWRGPGATDISLNHCAHMRIEGVKILGGAGFCVTEFGGDGGNYYNYTLSYPPKPDGADEEPLLASNADAFHSNSVRTGPTLENCLLEGMGDDGIPIHGWYAFVMEAHGDKVIVDAPMADWCHPGDELRILGDDRSVVGSAKVVSINVLDDYAVTNTHLVASRFYMLQDEPYWREITLDHAVPLKFGWSIGNVNACGNGFHIKNCTIRNSRTRAMLIKAGDGVIEGNTIDNTEGGIIVCPEVDVWAEADYAHNLVIKNNTIRGVGGDPSPGSSQAGSLTIAAYEQDHFVPRPGGHSNIVVTGNRFESNNAVNVLITSVKDVTIRDNTFVRPMPQYLDRGSKLGIDPTSLFWLTECDGITLANNRVEQPGPAMRRLVTASPTASGAGFKDGVTIVNGGLGR